MKNYAEIREKAWAAINAARQQKERAQAANPADPQKETVHYVDSKEQLMEVLLAKTALAAIPG